MRYAVAGFVSYVLFSLFIGAACAGVSDDALGAFLYAFAAVGALVALIGGIVLVWMWAV